MVVAIAASPIRGSPMRYAVALDGLTHCQSRFPLPRGRATFAPAGRAIGVPHRRVDHATKRTTTVTRISDDLAT
jgi:hypothetical protein